VIPALLALLVAAAPAAGQEPRFVQALVSTGPGGVPADGDSTAPSISLDGATVAFHSSAGNLSQLDGDRVPDVYARQGGAADVILVSVSSGAAPVKGDGASLLPSVSGDGRLVLFASVAKNLVAGDLNGQTDIFLRDIAARTTVLASVSSAGVQGDGASDLGVLSAGGGHAVFQSLAGNLGGAPAPAGIYRIHVRDLEAGTTARIDLPDGRPADRDCLRPDPSRDGRWVVFHSASAGFDDRDAGDLDDVFRHDLRTSQTVRVSVPALAGAPADGPSSNARISADGRFVAFESLASNLVARDTNRTADVFVRDMLVGSIERVSVADGGEEAKLASSTNDISADGRFVLFETVAALVPEDRNGSIDVYARDRLRSRTILVSATFLGGAPAAADGDSSGGATSGDGLRIAFASAAVDIVPEDARSNSDVYVLGIERAPDGPFPASNHVLVESGGAVRQVGLDGTLTGRSLANAEVEGMAVDGASVLWVAGGGVLRRFQALGLEPLAGDPVQLPAGAVRDIAAAGGFAFVAVEGLIIRAGGDGDPVLLALDGGPEAVSLALDPHRHLWVGAAHAGFHEILELSLDLEVLNRIRRAAADPFREIACDGRGGLVARSRRSLARLSPAGGLLWSADVPEGHAVAIDAAGNAYTLAGPEVRGFSPGGKPFLRVPHGGGPVAPAGSRLAVDGEGRVWVLVEGARSALRFDPAADRVLVEEITVPVLGRQPAGDPTGYLAANVTSQRGDMDGDGFLNRDETLDRFNPFAAADPPPARRLPPLTDLSATSLGSRRVRLDWATAEPYAFFHVFRDRRPIPGSPFAAALAARGVIDTQVPGGLHRYRVIGQGLQGRGGGAGLGTGEDDIEEPFSIATETPITLGEGGLIASVTLDAPPDAVAHDAAASRVLVALEGGILLTLGEDLAFVSEAALPAAPFASAEVRGMTVDAADPLAPLYLLLGDGRVFKSVGAADPALEVTLTGVPPSAAGFTGLAISGDLFATMAGPDLDCLIGFLRTTGAHQPGAETSLSGVLGQPIAVTGGLAEIGGGLLAGTGDGSGSSTIERVSRLDVGGGFAVSDAGANLTLGALGSMDIAGFDFAPGLGLVVADRGGSRVAILEASFAGSLRLLSVTPPVGSYNQTTPGVSLEGMGLGNEVADLWVGFDGAAVPIQAFDPVTGTLTVNADAPGRPLAVEVEVFSSTGFDSIPSGFTFGFERGDANDDTAVDISDAMRIFLFLFSGGANPPCPDAADVDDSGAIEITDGIRLLDFLFRGVSEPAPPHPFHGLDAEDDDPLGCGEE
jgi:Tol biopolymer transport system component